MGYRLAELAEILGAELRGDPERVVTGIRTLEAAGSDDLSFLTSPKYRSEAIQSRAAALLVGPWAEALEHDLLIVPDPYFSLSRMLELFSLDEPRAVGVHPTAIVDPEAKVDAQASVGAYAVISGGTRIEEGAVVHSHVVIGRRCVIARGAVLHPRVVLYDDCRVGAGSVLHAGVVLGSDGYGYAFHEGRHHKLKHLGRVVVEDDVEIGANTTIDRALLDETRIGEGTKIDNLVQVAHNVSVGRRCLLISQVGIAGSTKLGDGVIMAGQSGAAGHLTLGDGVQVAGKSAVFQSVEPGRKIAGIPAIEASVWRRQQAIAAKLGEMRKRIRKLEQALAADEEDGEVD